MIRTASYLPSSSRGLGKGAVGAGERMQKSLERVGEMLLKINDPAQFDGAPQPGDIVENIQRPTIRYR